VPICRDVIALPTVPVPRGVGAPTLFPARTGIAIVRGCPVRRTTVFPGRATCAAFGPTLTRCDDAKTPAGRDTGDWKYGGASGVGTSGVAGGFGRATGDIFRVPLRIVIAFAGFPVPGGQSMPIWQIPSVLNFR
jgi:hypothetical protein